MGVDLKLLPLLDPDMWVAHDILTLNRRRDLWLEFEAVPQQDIPKPLTCHEATAPDGEQCYGDIETDKYGDLLQWATAGDILALKNHPAVKTIGEIAPFGPILPKYHRLGRSFFIGINLAPQTPRK